MVVENDYRQEQHYRAQKIIQKKPIDNTVPADISINADQHKQRKEHGFKENIERKNIRSQKETGYQAQKQQAENHHGL